MISNSGKSLRELQAWLVQSLQDIYRRPSMYEVTPCQLEVLISMHMIVLAETWDMLSQLLTVEERCCESAGMKSLNLARQFALKNPNANPEDTAEFVRSMYARIASGSGLLAKIVAEGFATETLWTERGGVESAKGDQRPARERKKKAVQVNKAG